MADPVHISLLLDEPPASPADRSGAAEPLSLMAGQEVSGTVQVVAVEEVEFVALRVGFLWHTEGKGNRVTGSGGAVSLLKEGGWQAGARVLLPFSLKAPPGPTSYRGKILKVVWELEARLDRSMLKSDVVASTPVELRPDPEASEVDLGPTPQQKGKLEAAKRGLGGLWISFAIVLLLGGIVFGAANNWELLRGEKIFLFFLMVGGFSLMLKGIWGRLGRGKLGEPTIQLSTSELRLGESIRFSLGLRPEQRTELRSLDVTLECEERVVHGHGQYQSHHRKVVFEKKLSLAEDVVIDPHRGFRKRGTVTLPEEGPPSFGAPDNQVVWWLRFRGDIVGWPDWKEPFLLTVRP